MRSQFARAGRDDPAAGRQDGPGPSRAYDEVAAVARAAFRAEPRDTMDFGPSADQLRLGKVGDEEAMQAFVGPGWAAYRRLWTRTRGERLTAAFGYGPALFGCVWLIYRKRYVLGFALLAIEAVIARQWPLIGVAVAFVARLLLSQMGKSLILVDGLQRLRELDGASMTAMQKLSYLRGKGGVNLLAALLTLAGEGWLAVSDLDAVHGLGLGVGADGLLGNVLNALP